MAMHKALIADGTEEFRQILAKKLQDHQYIVQSCDNGDTAVELLRSFRPDVMVLDLMLPQLDGIAVLEKADEQNLRPIVLAVTTFSSPYVEQEAARLKVDHFMRKPCDFKSLLKHLSNLVEKSEPPMFSNPDQRVYVTNCLLKLGMPSKLMGYRFLREAVVLMIKDPRQSMMKELYPAVAQECKATTMQVERDIRGAIAAAWVHRDNPTWQKLFPPRADGTNSRPTNANFISRLADAVVSEQYTQNDHEQLYTG